MPSCEPNSSGAALSPDPLEFCPVKTRGRYRRAAKAIVEGGAGALKSAIKLKCLDCVCWDYKEAKKCEITGCPLWAFNRRIFK